MADDSVGGLEYRGRGYRFREAHCSWEPGGELFIEATGERCGLRLVGVPFPGVTEVTELPGRVWEPDDEELSRWADVLAEGGLEVRGRQLWILTGRIQCRRYDPDREVLVLAFRLQVQDGEYGRADEADGILSCQVE